MWSRLNDGDFSEHWSIVGLVSPESVPPIVVITGRPDQIDPSSGSTSSDQGSDRAPRNL